MIYQSVSGGVGPRLIHKHKAHSQKKGNSPSECGVMLGRGSKRTHARTHARSLSWTSVALSPIFCTWEHAHFEVFHKKVQYVEHKATLQLKQRKYFVKVVWIFPSLSFWVIFSLFNIRTTYWPYYLSTWVSGAFHSLMLPDFNDWHLLIWTANPTSLPSQVLQVLPAARFFLMENCHIGNRFVMPNHGSSVR